MVGALTSDVEAKVREAQLSEPDSGPPNCLFVPNSAGFQVLQRGHSSQLSC